MKPIDGRASITFSSSTTRSRWIGSGSTGCCGPKGMIVRAMVWVSVIGGGQRGGGCCWSVGQCRRSRRSRLYDWRFGAAEGEFHRRLIEMAVEVHRHAIHLHVEQVVQLILIEERAPVDGADTWQPGSLGEHLEAQVRQA